MKTATLLAITFATLTSIPLSAQQVNADASAQQSGSAVAAGAHASDSVNAGAAANAGLGGVESKDSAHASGAAGASDFGEGSASRVGEMSSVSGELEGKLDSKTAKFGDRVVLKTTKKVQIADGTEIPKGSHLVGHVTEVQAHDKEHAVAHMGIVFDHAELKNGENVAIHTLIRGVSPGANAMAAASMSSDDAMGASMSGEGDGRMGGGQAMGGGRAGGSLLGGASGAVSGTGGLAGGAVARTGDTTGTVGARTGAAVDSSANAAVQTAGRGGLGLDSAANGIAGAHFTGVPGVMLAGNSSASGMLSASKKNIHFDSGTQMQLGIAADR